ncbi:formyltransferase family protein [Gracilimonas sp.]|uniref:formyltransferase family protein n=1 Tax=Gracilimonas sp. TaxID=1974203 RepID=UPI003BAB471B
MLIQILVDNTNSWIIPYANELIKQLENKGHEVYLIHSHDDVKEGDILCLLSCERIFKELHLNKHNLVVHESDLPKGKGWSPLTWQILEGKDKIPITLFEASKEVDAGDIYAKEYIHLEGHELLDEIKHLQGLKTKKMIIDFVETYPNLDAYQQEGESTFYPRRKPIDSELDIDKSIKEQFNLLRVSDNERYPAYFELNGKKYLIKIYKDERI